MARSTDFDSWSAGQSYEHYMGRWSRRIAEEFLDWLAPPHGANWVEIGCGSGALTAQILSRCAPASVLATDQSADFVAYARAAVTDPRARFDTAAAGSLPVPDASVDLVVSALVLNFVPDKTQALQDMMRALRPGGTLAFYVWDYPGGGMGFIDAFWSAAAKLDPAAADLDEARRFPFCTAVGLAQICVDAGLSDVTVAALETVTEFPDFEAFWHPFTLGAGPAPGYCNSLPEPERARLKAQLRADLGGDGAVQLPARAWAVRITKAP